jgi:hypothetical protein
MNKKIMLIGATAGVDALIKAMKSISVRQDFIVAGKGPERGTIKKIEELVSTQYAKLENEVYKPLKIHPKHRKENRYNKLRF